MKQYWFILSLASLVSILACKTIKPMVTTPNLSAITPPVLVVHKSLSVFIAQTVATTNCVTNKIGQYVCYTNVPRVFTTLKSFGWTYSGVTDNVVFLVYYSTNLSSTNNWKYIGQVSTQWFTVDATNQLDYYRIKASNVVSHFVSGL